MERNQQIKSACDGLAIAISLMPKLHYEDKVYIFKEIAVVEKGLKEQNDGD
jgi:hypothetical protein